MFALQKKNTTVFDFRRHPLLVEIIIVNSKCINEMKMNFFYHKPQSNIDKLPRRPPLCWPLLVSQHHTAGQEGPAAATLSEGAQEGAVKHKTAGDPLLLHHWEPADLLCDSVTLQLHRGRQEKTAEGYRHCTKDHRLPVAAG